MKKMWFIPIVIAVVGLAAAGVYLLNNRSSTVSSESSASKISSTPTPAPVELVTWKDDVGFSFQYPKDIAINKHEEDDDNYAHVELTHKDHVGSIIVWAKDLPVGVTTLDSLVKKKYSTAMALDTKLGGEPAKKILVTTPAKVLTVATITDDLLFLVEGTFTDEEYWQKVHDTITGSFSFVSDDTPAQAVGAGSGASAGGDSDIDEEEVVQ